MSLIPHFIGGIIFTVLQFIVFLFVLVATPIAQFNFRGDGKECLTLWGLKVKCSSTTYDARGVSAFGCGHRRNNMNGGAAFAIISIFTTLVALVFAVLMIVKVSCSIWIPAFFTVFSCMTILISWACVAGVYTTRMCSDNGVRGTKMSEFATYGAGFGLMVTAWCLQVLNTIFLFIFSFL